MRCSAGAGASVASKRCCCLRQVRAAPRSCGELAHRFAKVGEDGAMVGASPAGCATQACLCRELPSVPGKLVMNKQTGRAGGAQQANS